MMNARERYDSLFQYYGAKYMLDWTFLKAQAIQESGLDPDARSRVGASGLAQFMPATWKELVERAKWVEEGDLVDPRDPEDGIHAQARMMSWLLKETKGDTDLALAAYNWGIGRVTRTFLIPGIKYDPHRVPDETRDYIARIHRIWAELRGHV